MSTKQQFDEFIAAYLESAYKLAEIYIKDSETAKDVVAESIEKALRNLNTLRDPSTMKSWFNKIIINTSIDFLRKQPKPTLPERPSYYFDDFSHLNIEDLLEVLPERDRKIVSLRFLDDYALGEIAAELGMNENTVKTRLYRALKKLKLEVTGEGYSVNVKKSKATARTLTTAVFAVLLSAALFFNLAPTIAAAAYDIPIIGNIVKVITFNRFEFQDNGYNAEIKVPEITGLLDTELEARLNAEFHDNVTPFIDSFEQTYLELKKEFGDELVHFSIKSDYSVLTDTERVISLNAYIYSDVVNFEVHNYYTLDKQAGSIVTLESLFKPDADYITPISAYIVQEMERYNAEVDRAYFVGDYDIFGAPFTHINPDHHFYITEDSSLVICFAKHEVAAGSIRRPEFVIPTELIQDILASDLIS